MPIRYMRVIRLEPVYIVADFSHIHNSPQLRWLQYHPPDSAGNLRDGSCNFPITNPWADQLPHISLSLGVLPSRDPCPNTESFDDGALSCNVTYGVSAHWWLRPWGRFWRIAIVTSPCRNLLADSRKGIHWQVLYLVRCRGESVTALLGVYDIYIDRL